MIHVIPLDDWFAHETLPDTACCSCGGELYVDWRGKMLIHCPFDTVEDRDWAVVPVREATST